MVSVEQMLWCKDIFVLQRRIDEIASEAYWKPHKACDVRQWVAWYSILEKAIKKCIQDLNIQPVGGESINDECDEIALMVPAKFLSDIEQDIAVFGGLCRE